MDALAGVVAAPASTSSAKAAVVSSSAAMPVVSLGLAAAVSVVESSAAGDAFV